MSQHRVFLSHSSHDNVVAGPSLPLPFTMRVPMSGTMRTVG